MKRLLGLFPWLALAAFAQPAGTVKPTVADTITLHAYADNWCAIFVNGKLVAADAIDFLPHNQISVRILPEYPLTIAVLAKDNAAPASGYEYGDRIGDAGFILRLGDGTVTDARWKAKAFFRGPLGTGPNGPVVERIPLPDRWYAPDFDDRAWEFATEYPAERVGPDGDYVAADFAGARFIWTGDLNLDNTVVLRTTVAAPRGHAKRWNTVPDLDVTQLPAEILPVAAAGAGAGQLANLSTRAMVGLDDAAVIPGFVLAGGTSRSVLVRAVGPGLARFGVGGLLADPVLTVQRGGAPVGANDNWQEGGGGAAVAAAAQRAGAFPLEAGSRDSALVLTLEPGAYTFRVEGAARGTGVALVEVYVLP